MRNPEKTYKAEHPVAGVILGILGIGAALVLCLLAGVIGGAIAVILGVLALLLGFQARKSGKGLGAILTGVVALVMAVVMTFSSIGIMGVIREKAEASGVAPLIAKYSDKPCLGLMGFVLSAANHQEDLEALNKEMSALTEGMKDSAT